MKLSYFFTITLLISFSLCAQQKLKENEEQRQASRMDFDNFFERLAQFTDDVEDSSDDLHRVMVSRRKEGWIAHKINNIARLVHTMNIDIDNFKRFKDKNAEWFAELELLDAVNSGSESRIQAVLEQEVRPSTSVHGAPIFFKLANKPNLLKIFLSKGVSIDTFDSYGNTMFFDEACHSLIGNYKTRHSGACIGIDDWTTVETYAAEPVIKTIQQLKELGANINAQNKDGDTSLLYCVRHKRLQIVRALLEMGADTEIKNNKGESFKDYLEPQSENDSEEIKQFKSDCSTIYAKVRASIILS